MLRPREPGPTRTSLKANYLGTYDLPLKSVDINGRLLTDSWRAKIKASMDSSGGFLKHHTPLVVIESHDEPSGQLSSDALAKAPVRILDGANRTNALRKKYGEDGKFAFRLYRDFGGVTHTIIASALNTVTEAVVVRGVADKVLFFNALVEAYRTENGTLPTWTQLMNAHKTAGAAVPSRISVRNRYNTEMGMSPTAFRRLVSFQESSSSDASIDMGSFTWTILSASKFTEFAREDGSGDESQALMLEHIARFKSLDDKNKAPTLSDLPNLAALARESWDFHIRTATVKAKSQRGLQNFAIR